MTIEPSTALPRPSHTDLRSVCPQQATENEPGDMDLSGLPETAVDSEEDDDEEDIERASDPLMSRDIVRDCLEKDPMDRTDDDIGELPGGVGGWGGVFYPLLISKHEPHCSIVCNVSHSFLSFQSASANSSDV